MKKHTLFLTSAIIPLLFLAGCAEQDSISLQNANSKNSNNQQNVAISSQIENPTITPPSPADQTAYAGAMNLKDLSLCQKIQDEQYKNQCTSALKDEKILEQALTTKDKTVCDQISTDAQKQNCVMQITVLEEAQTKQAQSQQQIDADSKLEVEIIKSGDYTRCSQITTYGSEFECEVNILAQKAITTKDKTWCQKGSTDEIKSACEQQIVFINK